jgi:hypothetical protein
MKQMRCYKKSCEEPVTLFASIYLTGGKKPTDSSPFPDRTDRTAPRVAGSQTRSQPTRKSHSCSRMDGSREREGDLARDLRIGINAHVKIDTPAIFTIVRGIVKNRCRLARAGASVIHHLRISRGKRYETTRLTLRAAQQCLSCSLRKFSEVFLQILSPR